MTTQPLSTASIRAHLSARPAARAFCHEVLYFTQTGSTNDVCRFRAAEGAPEGVLVVADEQTAGRGRLSRRWQAPPGTALLLSLLFRPPLAPEAIAQLTMLCSLATAEALEAETGLALSLKWPNDLLIGEHKCAGLLAELSLTEYRVEYAVVGIGLNVSTTPAEFGPLAAHATSLAQALGRPLERLPLLAAIIERIATRYRALRGGTPIAPAWRARLATLGRAVTVSTGAHTYTGIAEHADDDGALHVRLADGTLNVVKAGDVTLRPPDEALPTIADAPRP